MEELNKNNNIAFLNYLKAFAIICVIIHHFSFTRSQFTNPIFLYLVYMAVPVFMFVTGFVYTKSYLRNNITKLKNLYNIKLILKRFLRICVPFILIFIIEYYFNMNGLHNSNNLFLDFIQGGAAVGKGSYYFPVILQIIIFFPLIYFIIKKFNYKGFILLFLLEFLYSFYCYYHSVCVRDYRLQAFRYITLLASGCWLALNSDIKINRKYLILSLMAGVLYIYLAGYINYPIPYGYPYWKSVSGIFITMYIFPILYYLYKKYSNVEVTNILGKTIDFVGKSSWHIYLVQMVYYISVEKYMTKLNFYPHIFLNILICIFAGVLFYYAERKILKLIYPKYCK